MWLLVVYIISVIISGAGLYARYLDRRDYPLSNFEMFLAIATPFIPCINLMVLIGLVDEYMRKK